MKIYLDCPGIPQILSQILVLKPQTRPLNYIKLREMTLSSCKWRLNINYIVFIHLCMYELIKCCDYVLRYIHQSLHNIRSIK